MFTVLAPVDRLSHMDPYPASLSSQQNGQEQNIPKRLAEESGQYTPSHDGMVTGMEYDMAIAAKPGNRVPSPLRPTHATNGNMPATHSIALETPTEPHPDPQTSTPAGTSEPSAVPIPRTPATNGSAQRPASMPPQPNALDTTGGESRSRNHESQHRSKQGGRVLGSYTMTKTLGAGSMGKVKLASHNQTGEKVCCLTAAGVPLSASQAVNR